MSIAERVRPGNGVARDSRGAVNRACRRGLGPATKPGAACQAPASPTAAYSGNPRPHGFKFVTGADREKQMVSGDPGPAEWTVVLRGTGGSEVPASKLPPESSLSPWRQMGPGEVAWDVDRYNLPHGEDLAPCSARRAGRFRTPVLCRPCRA